MSKRDDVSGLEILKARVFTSSYLWKKTVLFSLCLIHEFTCYKVSRSLRDVFYWPDGFCADTIVVICFLVMLMWSLWDDCKLLLELLECFNNDLKDIEECGFKIFDNDDRDD